MAYCTRKKNLEEYLGKELALKVNAITIRLYFTLEISIDD